MVNIEHVRSRFIKHFRRKDRQHIRITRTHQPYWRTYRLQWRVRFPGAVDKGIMAEVRPNGTDTVMCYSIDLKDRVEFKVDDPNGPRASWARYIYGIIQEMKKLGVKRQRL